MSILEPFRRVTYDDLELRRFYLQQICQEVSPPVVFDATVAYVAFQVRGSENLEDALNSYNQEIISSFDSNKPDIFLLDLIGGVKEAVSKHREDIYTLAKTMEERLVYAKKTTVQKYGGRYPWMIVQEPQRIFRDLIDPSTFAKVAGHYSHPLLRFWDRITHPPPFIGNIDKGNNSPKED